MLSGGQLSQFAAEHSRVHDAANTEQQRLEHDYPPPPKKPLTPYMRFNKLMWNEVKGSNPSMGVCEVSAAIGQLWRELGPEEKQRHNHDYTQDKVRYDEELKVYLKLTGLRSSDVAKMKAKKSRPPQSRRPAGAPPPYTETAQTVVQQPVAVAQPPQYLHHQPQQQRQQVPEAAASSAAGSSGLQQSLHQQQQQQQLQAFMGLPVGGGSLPLGFQNVGMLSGLPQMWATAGQPYPSSLMSATQLQELCGSSANTSAAQLQHPVAAAAAANDPQQLAALLRYQQSLMQSRQQ